MVSQSYSRKRRLAGILAVLSLLLLAAGYGFDLIAESYSNPLIAADGDAFHIAYVVFREGSEEIGARASSLDASLRIQAVHPLDEPAGAILARQGETCVFQGTRYSMLSDGVPRRVAALMQKWDVMAAAAGPAQDQSWIFGWHEGRIVARRIVRETASEEIPVADSRSVERLAAVADPAGTGLLVAWRERGSSSVRTARYDGRAFSVSTTFEIGAAKHWDAVLHRGRAMIVFHNSEDRGFGRIAFRALCCPGCGAPVPESIALGDPLHLIGRQVTGLAAAVSGDRMVLFVTRAAMLQAAALPAATLVPGPGARMIPLGTEPAWRRLAAALWPIFMMFLSFALVFLGLSLMREQRRQSAPDRRRTGPRVPQLAQISDRAMAHVLDLLAIMPVFFVVVEFLDLSPLSAEPDISDPRVLGVWFGLRFLYGFASEWLWGRTPGKKILGIQVIEPGRARLSFRAALVRNLVRLFDADVHPGVFLGAALIMTSPKRQRLGDMVARTIVVQDEPAEEKEEDRGGAETRSDRKE